jgi:hypothetical protein
LEIIMTEPHDPRPDEDWGSSQTPWQRPPQQPQPGQQPGQSGPQPPPTPPPGWQQAPPPGWQPPPYEQPRTPAQSGTQTLSIVAFICAGLSVLFLPILFGPAGIVLGIVGNSRGERLGRPAAITSAICMVIGFIIAFAILSNM